MTQDTRKITRHAFRYSSVYWLWLAVVVIVADQISKALIARHMELFARIDLTSFLNLVCMHNTGAAFSLFTGAMPVVFIVIAVAVTIGVLVWLRRNPDAPRLLAIALSLIVGGALGNAIDRVARGYVIDFIDVHAYGWHWPAFNVADSAITIGAILLIVDMLLLQSARAKTSD